jgi:mannose-1-phosphate guanylyltransferase/phosphomannomutase
MGRYSIQTSLENYSTNSENGEWPKSFPKQTIGIDRNGIIVKSDRDITSLDDLEIVPGCLEAIKLMRLKGYKVVLFFNEPLISKGIVNPSFVDSTNQKLMQIFGQAGIMTIEGLLYSTTNFKEDIYSLPNNGMLKKAEKDFHVKFKGGYFVGDKIIDLKVADSVDAKPVLIKCGEYEETLNKLTTFANKNLKKKTLVFNSLMEFANHLS